MFSYWFAVPCERWKYWYGSSHQLKLINDRSCVRYFSFSIPQVIPFSSVVARDPLTLDVGSMSRTLKISYCKLPALSVSMKKLSLEILKSSREQSKYVMQAYSIRCLSHMLSSDKVCNLVGANANIMGLLVATTQNVLELRFTIWRHDYCCSFLHQRCIECVGTAWIDLDKHLAQSRNMRKKKNILEAQSSSNAISRLVQVCTVGH